MNWRERVAERFFGDLITRRVQNAVKVVDDKWWASVSDAAAPNDLHWSTRRTILDTALTAWRENPLARQLVRLTRGFVLQDGIGFRAENKRDQQFVDEFWTHPKSRMPQRLRQWCDALVLFGEVFPVLFTNHADGMSYVRSVPAKAIDDIVTKPGDYETALEFHQLTADGAGRGWAGSEMVMDRWTTLPDGKPEMLHLAVNVPDGGTRGSGDLDPVLTWLQRYSDWLNDRWVINKAKGNYVWDLSVEGGDQDDMRLRKHDLMRSLEGVGGFYVHNEKETLKVVYPGINADSVEPDGRALRLMIAAGGGVSLHHLGENDSVTRASSGASDRGTLSHYATRQKDLIEFCQQLLDRAAWRAAQVGRVTYPRGGFKTVAEVAELTREDNLMLAQAAHEIVGALASAKELGWIDDAAAAGLMLKFAGDNAEGKDEG